MMQLIGYAGSVLVAVSLMMSNIWRLRWLNLAGAAFFVVYGVAVRAYPVALLNAFIVAVDAYYLGMMAAKKDYFRLYQVCHADEAPLKGFLEAHREDIARFFPGFALHRVESPRCVLTLRNLMPVGLFVYEAAGKDTVRIHVDYVAPEYRDLRNAHFLYSAQAGLLTDQGFARFEVRPESKAFESYVSKLGFAPVPATPGLYAKTI